MSNQADQLRREKQFAKTKLWLQGHYAEGAIRGIDIVLRLSERITLSDSEMIIIYRRLAEKLRAMKAAKDTVEPFLDRAVSQVLKTLQDEETADPKCTCGASSDPGSCGHHPSCPRKKIDG